MPAVPVIVLEKEPAVARHQSGRNSGILHSGLYYAPGSLKSLLASPPTQATTDNTSSTESPTATLNSHRFMSRGFHSA